MPDTPDSARSNSLLALLIAPDPERRRSLAMALAGSQFLIAKQFDAWPSPGDLRAIAPLNCCVAFVDVDRDVEQAIETIESICRHNASMTVMALSTGNDPAVMLRAMQAGVREFLYEPVTPDTLSAAFSRDVIRHHRHPAAGKILAFVPTKSGVGVTTLAVNFGLALTKESGAKVVVVDMDLELGEVALGLGMTASFSIADALLNPSRLDRDFLSTLLLRHSSGLAVLASPEEYRLLHYPREGADRLFRVLREEFDYVVVDAGTSHGYLLDPLFEVASTVYLVTEMSFPALRNAHRLISFLSAKDKSRNLEVVLNRFNSRNGNIDEKSATKALARPVNWRIPNCYEAARAAEDNGVPLAMEDSPITRALEQMARSACGKPLKAAAKRGRNPGLFGSKWQPVVVET
jgi:pilus assembly protein CpaE